MFNFGVTTPVLTKFSVDREATDTPTIEVAGRASGFMAWLLTQMNLKGLAIVAAVFFALYYFSNRMFISISAGGETAMIAFKKGLIEGEQVDLE